MRGNSVQSHRANENDVLQAYEIFSQRTSRGQDIWKPRLGTALSLWSLGWRNSRDGLGRRR